MKLPKVLTVPGLPHVKVCRHKTGRFLIKGGALMMVTDAVVRVGVTILSIHFLHGFHDWASVIGVNGAALAGLGAWLDLA